MTKAHDRDTADRHWKSFVGRCISNPAANLGFYSYSNGRFEVGHYSGNPDDYIGFTGTPEEIAEKFHFGEELKERFFDIGFVDPDIFQKMEPMPEKKEFLSKNIAKPAMECVKLAMEKYQKETGTEQLEDGESVVAVFDNCTIVITKEDGGIKIKLIEGKPIRVYADCDVYADREGRQ